MPKIYKRLASFKDDQTIVIGILSVGEHQLDNLLRQLSLLNFDLDIYIFDTFENATAHQKLYDLFNEKKEHLRIKFDADMTIDDMTKLEKEIELVRTLKNKCHIYQLYDFFTKNNIFGVHFYSPQFIINIRSIDFGSAFVDQFIFEDVRLIHEAFINHGEDHTQQQLNDFIVHRLRKSFQSRDVKKKVKYLRNAYRASPTIYTFFRICFDKKVYSSSAYKNLLDVENSEVLLKKHNFIREID